jgi:hypothetical protein
MKKILFALTMTATAAMTMTITAANANAINWPWEQPAAQQAPEFCKGFVLAGLASDQVSGVSRTDLWLAWSYVIRGGALAQNSAAEEFQAGRAKFQNVADREAGASIVRDADGKCGLGRSGLQITGW